MLQRSFRAISMALWCASSLPAADWKPVNPAELAEKKPTIDPNASAEALLWEVRLEDVNERAIPADTATLMGRGQAQSGTPSSSTTVLDNYMRIKIYNNAGRDRFSTIHIDPYNVTSKITDISGRTIQPDGEILELAKDAVFDGKTFQWKYKAFAMPGVVPGSVIEYRWRETRPFVLGYLVLPFQNDLPIRLVRYFVKPSAENLGTPTIQAFHAEVTPLKKEPGGFFSTTLADVPASKYEPYMPPHDEMAAWLLIFYKADPKETPQQFWLGRAKSAYDTSRSRTWQVGQDVRRLATELTQGVSTADEKLARLYDYCRLHILDRFSALATVDQRNASKANETPSDILNQKIGSQGDIRKLFGALAIAAGFDARLAELPSRSGACEAYAPSLSTCIQGILSFNPSYPNAYFTSRSAIAVRVGGSWRLYDPASRYVPPGMLPWGRQGVYALISDPKELVFVRTPISAPEKSAINSVGHFRLGEDGTLEGDATIEFTGLEGAKKKLATEAQGQEGHEAAVKALMRRIPAGEVSEIKAENATDPDKPFAYRFHLRVPNYAQVTGKRVLFAPAVFEQGLPAKFTAKDRINDVSFENPWMETDSVTIDLPDGYLFDSEDMPKPFQIDRFGQYQSSAEVRGARQLVYSRRFTFGEGGVLRFPVTVYPSIKTAFEAVHDADNHTFALKVADAVGVAK